MRIVFIPLAERRIDTLHADIASRSWESRADDYVGRIVAFCEGLATFPLRGTQRDDLLARVFARSGSSGASPSPSWRRPTWC